MFMFIQYIFKYVYLHVSTEKHDKLRTDHQRILSSFLAWGITVRHLLFLERNLGCELWASAQALVVVVENWLSVPKPKSLTS